MNKMLNRELREFIAGPLQLIVNLGGDDGDRWEEELKRFLRKEPCWCTQVTQTPDASNSVVISESTSKTSIDLVDWKTESTKSQTQSKVVHPEPIPVARIVPPPTAFVEPSAKVGDNESKTTRAKPVCPVTPGRGGTQHQAIQERIKKVAEELGFRSLIEKEILEGRGSVDLLLERNDVTFACEISVTTTIDHEVGNVAKCLKAGFLNVVVICINEGKLEKIRAAVMGSLGKNAATRVHYYTPDLFVAHLETISIARAKALETPKIRKGYKVKISFASISPEERRLRENEVISTIVEAMQRKQK